MEVLGRDGLWRQFTESPYYDRAGAERQMQIIADGLEIPQADVDMERFRIAEYQSPIERRLELQARYGLDGLELAVMALAFMRAHGLVDDFEAFLAGKNAEPPVLQESA